MSKRMLETIRNNNILKRPYFGLIAILIFIIWVLASEYGAGFWGGNSGAFIWTTFHFILNPFLGLLLTFFLIWNSIKQEKMMGKVVSFVTMFIPLFISYISFTGNIWWIKLLGLGVK